MRNSEKKVIDLHKILNKIYSIQYKQFKFFEEVYGQLNEEIETDDIIEDDLFDPPPTEDNETGSEITKFDQRRNSITLKNFDIAYADLKAMDILKKILQIEELNFDTGFKITIEQI